MKHCKLFFILIVVFCNLNVEAQTDTTSGCYNCCRPDAIAPAGIMTDHVHEKGTFGIAYSYMTMQMQNNTSDDEVFKTYMMSPNKMQMQMHMLMPMYGITNRLTVMAMITYNVNNMSMHMMPMQNMMMNMPGMTMTDYSNMPTASASSGLGDTKIYALYNLLKDCGHRLILGAGVSLPTGSITAKGPTMQSNNDVLSYSMQLGTGTYNILPSLVYVWQRDKLSFGASFNANIKTGVNSRNYCSGNEYSLSSWLAYKVLPWASFSFRAEAYSMDKIFGYDAQINQSSLNDPTANVNNYGTQRVSAYAGINLYAPSTVFKRIRLLVEYGMPAYQNLQGLQMSVKSSLTARLQYNF